uniref:PGG domain-containing protein n=1 Tax=Chenopodium quinoa TaxID=63459 RepID=A0A803LY19_CHEQI
MTSSKMDEELRKAAVRGDVDFLKKCVESNKPIEYYLTFYPEEDDQSGRAHHGNIFHMAARENKEEFIKEAMGILPQEAKHQLLVQPGYAECNPLHEAACVGNVVIVKMFLDVYQQGFRSHLLEHQRPWLFKDSDGNNPCFVAVISHQEECAFEIYKMDTELISNMHSYRGSSLVYEAVHKKMSNLALVILKSPHPISCNGYDGYTPFHSIHYLIEGSEMLIDIYKKESPSLSNNQHPWLVKDIDGNTPLSLAIAHKNENPAIYLLSVDENVVTESKKNVLFLAVEVQCHTLAEEILKIIDNKGWNQLLTNHQKLNILHLAPLCTENFCAQLMESHPELIKGVDKEGSTIVHSWVKSDKEWLFKFILESEWKDQFVKLVDVKDYNYQDNPFHVAATTTHKATNQIVPLLVEAYKVHKFSWSVNAIYQLPWFEKNKENEGPLHLALHNKREDLALYILSLLRDDQIMDELLDYYEPEHSTLFLAIQNKCSEVAKVILGKLDKRSRTKYLKDSSTGRNILHLATSLTDEEFGTWLVNEAPEFITEQDNNKQSPWDTAYETGCAWFIKVVLKKDPFVFNRAPLAWIKACEHGHVSALRTFIDHNPAGFRDLCIKHKNTPLHRMKLSSLTEYEELLTIPRMKDLINVQNSQGKTPLHLAVQNRILPLTETLLGMEKIAYNIKDEDQNTPIDLLEQACIDDSEWEEMCQRIGFNPWIKTSYFQRRTNLLEVRNSLFVVAALLATITFTAGFTLPGGLNQESGEALLAKKVAFLVFLMSNTLAMCTSMLVLICLVWSMVQDSSNSLVLIDRSLVLLMVAFYSTILAFMTGVYVVIYPKLLWAAIIVIIMCSLIGVSANRTFLYKVLLISSAKKKQNQRDPMYLLELGKAFRCCKRQ